MLHSNVVWVRGLGSYLRAEKYCLKWPVIQKLCPNRTFMTNWLNKCVRYRNQESFVYRISQWKTMLYLNIVSYRLGPYPELSLMILSDFSPHESNKPYRNGWQSPTNISSTSMICQKYSKHRQNG